MKRLIIFLTVSLCILCFRISAQNSSCGIYLSGNDFNNQKLSYTKNENKKYKIKLHDIFYKPYINVAIGDSVITLYKDSIFGYRDNSNISYRFFKGTIYTVMNSEKEIILHERVMYNGTKGSQIVIKYYFSKDASSPVLPLTIMNLKNSFVSSPSFQELLDMYFRSDDELLRYDNYNKMYKLNHIYKVSQLITIKTN